MAKTTLCKVVITKLAFIKSVVIILTCGVYLRVCVCVCIPPFSPVYKHPPNLFLIRLNGGQTSLANIDIGWVSNVQDSEKLEGFGLVFLFVF